MCQSEGFVVWANKTLVATAAVTTAAAQTPVATAPQPPKPSAEPTPTKARHEKRAALKKAGDDGEQAKNTKARQKKRAANKKAGDKRENKRRRERRTRHQEQWKSDTTYREFIKLFAHTTGARVTANLQLFEQFARRSRVASELSDRTSRKTSTNRRNHWQ